MIGHNPKSCHTLIINSWTLINAKSMLVQKNLDLKNHHLSIIRTLLQKKKIHISFISSYNFIYFSDFLFYFSINFQIFCFLVLGFRLGLWSFTLSTTRGHNLYILMKFCHSKLNINWVQWSLNFIHNVNQS